MFAANLIVGSLAIATVLIAVAVVAFIIGDTCPPEN